MIAIIIVGYNSRRFLKACLESIKKSTVTDYKVIFVDNESTDTSVAYVKKSFPEVAVIQNDGNYGFAKANNIGIRHAMALGASAVFLLNPDTVIDADCLARLVRHNNKKTILQPLILLDPRRRTKRINTTGGVLTFLSFSYCSDYQESDTIDLELDRPIGSGAALFIPTAVLKKIGLFDETFFMYHEDVDLTWRARLAGYTIRLVPEARVWHDYHFSRNQAKFFYVERNRLAFLVKNFSGRYLVACLPSLILNEFAVWAYCLKEGLAGMKWRSYGSLIRLTPRLMAARRMVQKTRRVSDRDLIGYLTPTVGFSEVTLPLLVPYNRLAGLYWNLTKSLL